MNIGIDLRALAGNQTSGVTVYLRSVLAELLRLDQQNNYFLWFNSAREKLSLPEIETSSRVKLIETRYPNRWLNYRLLFHEKPELDRLILSKAGRVGEKMDIFWLPDPRPVALSAGCKLVTTIHDLSPTRFPQFFSYKTRLWHRLLKPKAIAEKSDKILAVSHFTASELEKYWNIPRNKVSVTHLGVSEDFKQVTDPVELEKVRKKYGLPEKFVLSLSTLEPRKNLATLVKAFTELKKETDLPHALVLAGAQNKKIFSDPKLTPRPSLRPLLCSELRRGIPLHRGVEFSSPPVKGGLGGVLFPGFVQDSDKPALLSAASAFCFPSLYEGFGLPVLEALACGVPLVVSDIPALHEVAGSAATFVPAEDVEAWKDALQKALSSKLEAKSYSKFTWEKTAEKTLEVFEKIPEN
jgi:glycosyltransferase involved in cell wall biosynthesis